MLKSRKVLDESVKSISTNRVFRTNHHSVATYKQKIVLSVRFSFLRNCRINRILRKPLQLLGVTLKLCVHLYTISVAFEI